MITVRDDFVFGFSRGRGNMSFRHGALEAVRQNRADFLGAAGVDPQRLVCADQVHGSRAVVVGQEDAGKGALCFESSVADCDALVTDRSGLPLAVLTADCLPVIFFDPLARVAAAAHAGWRGSQKGVLKNTLELMGRRFGSKPEAITAVIGPGIRECCYQVSEDFKELFPREVYSKGKFFFLNLAEYNISQLINCGLKRENVHDCRLCTCCAKEDFFSYRRQGQAAGRMLAVVMIKEAVEKNVRVT